jgi:transcriptional regulator with XRE-family HTH domain
VAEEPPSALGEIIRRQRELSAMSMRQFSELVGISNPYLSQIERGLRRPSAEVLQALAKALQISAESLYVRAGLLTDEDAAAPSVREAIGRDPLLTAEQKQVLLGVYDSYVGR